MPVQSVVLFLLTIFYCCVLVIGECQGFVRPRCVEGGRGVERLVEEGEVVAEVKEDLSNAVVKYNGHRLLRMRIGSAEQLLKLRFLRRSWAERDWGTRAVDFWDEPLESGQEITVRVAPATLRSITKELRSANVTYSTLTDDLQKWIDKEAKENAANEDGLEARDGSFHLGMYHPLKEINESLVMLHQLHPNNTRLLVLGRTAEGRQITGIRVGTGSANRPAIFLDGGMHAREWISPASIMYLAHRLLDNQADNPSTEGLTDSVDWYIFPVINPDGYEYSWNSNRLWRKNRRKTTRFSRFCRGVDPNRNFGVHFGKRGSSANPCAENYGGTAAFSEKESQAVKTGIMRLKDRLVVYMNAHSYSQVIMSPYGYTKTKPLFYDEQEEAMKAFADGIRTQFNATFRYGTAANTMYHTSGAAIDWVHDVAKVKHSLVIELRDKGQFGFILPNEFIIPSGMELVQGFRHLIDHLKRRGELTVKAVNLTAAW
ncbi:zinc carboxypeptidase A 1-like [Tropilaelaps mercedesae]|uniref:Zinc carboxypeptidase A 1-like n=1 Tax=Tropilaelaps mercedesae TaxID=418985 RepID=A0A1V9XIT5_9ACAR|nr:zinc carboxypeptidase A 1-like [Tropilaelaps mercedesae]